MHIIVLHQGFLLTDCPSIEYDKVLPYEFRLSLKDRCEIITAFCLHAGCLQQARQESKGVQNAAGKERCREDVSPDADMPRPLTLSR